MGESKMTETFTYDVFISHSAKDRPVVRQLAERLKQDGLRVWFDEWEIQPGDMIGLKIEQGLEHGRESVIWAIQDCASLSQSVIISCVV